MRKYLPLVWILGSIAACSGNAAEGDGGDPDVTPAAGSATTSAGTTGAPQATGGTPNTGTGGTPSSAAGSSTTAGGPSGTAGTPTTAGTSSGGTTGVAGSGNAGAGGAGKKMPPDLKFPAPMGTDVKLSSSKEVTDFDGKGVRYLGTGNLGSGSSEEGQDPLFVVKAGGSLKNVILGAPAADGVHCEGSCTIENVWWEDVGEDAITLLGSGASNVYRITNSGARKASDKVIQHNGGGTLYVKSFLVEDFGKLYRSCGNCGDQYQRKSEFDNIVANGSKSVLAGINTKYNDSAKFTNIFADLTMTICERYDGNNTGAEPSSVGKGADGKYCIYSAADIITH